MATQFIVAIVCLVALQASAETAAGPACAQELSGGSQGMTLPVSVLGGEQLPPLVRVRRQLFQQQQQQQQPASDPLSFISNLGQQADKIQSSAKMFSSLFSSGPTSPQQATAASQIQQAFQPQQQAQPSAAALMSQLTEMVRATQDRSMKLASDASQSAGQVAQAGQQQAQQAQTGVQAALAEIGQGLQKIAMNNPGLLPDVKNLYSSVSSKLSSASSSFPQPGAQSFPSQGPIVPAKNGDQLIDNLAKVSMGQTQ